MNQVNVLLLFSDSFDIFSILVLKSTWLNVQKQQAFVFDKNKTETKRFIRLKIIKTICKLNTEEKNIF